MLIISVLAKPRHSFENDVPATEQRDEHLLDHHILADDHLRELSFDVREGRLQSYALLPCRIRSSLHQQRSATVAIGSLIELGLSLIGLFFRAATVTSYRSYKLQKLQVTEVTSYRLEN